MTQLYQIGTLAAAQTALGSTEYAFFTASLAGSSSALLGPLSSGFPAMFVGVAYSGSAVSKMCFQASNTAGGALWSVLGSMALISHVQTGDSSLQSKLQTAFGLTITGTACAAGTAGCTTSAVITSKIASGSNVVALAGGVLDLTAPVFETTHVKGASTLNFQITGNISISTGCTDAICSSFKSYLGASPVKAVGTGIPGNFSFTAPLANIQLSNDFTLTKANFMYKPSTEEMGIVGEIKIAADDTLTLTAEIAALFDGSKVELEGTMVGIWSSGECEGELGKERILAEGSAPWQ